MARGLYRRKVTGDVEAVQFTGENWVEVEAFCGTRTIEGLPTAMFWRDEDELRVDPANATSFISVPVGRLWSETKRTVLPVERSDWVLKDRLGLSICKDDTFMETYETISEKQGRIS